MKTSFTIFTISLLLSVVIDGLAKYVHAHYYISTTGVRAAFLSIIFPIIVISGIVTIVKVLKRL